MLSQSSNGRCTQGHDSNSEPARNRFRRDDESFDEDSFSSDETSSSGEDSSDEDSSDEYSSFSEDSSSIDDSHDSSDEEDNAASEDENEDEDDGVNFGAVGTVVNQSLNPPRNPPAGSPGPDDPAAPPPVPEIHFDEDEIEAITDRVLEAVDPDNMATSIPIVVTMFEEVAGGHAPTLRMLVGHVMAVLERMQHPEEFGVRNPAPPYSLLPRVEEVTMELAARLPGYIGYSPRYTRKPLSPPAEDSHGLRGQKRKEDDDDGGEEEDGKNNKENDNDENDGEES